MAERDAAGRPPPLAARFLPAPVAAAFTSLRIRNFRYLWFGQVGAATAMHADMLARSWLTWELTGSSLAVATVNVARAVPMLAFGLFGGVVADRFDRRRVLMAIQAWSLVLQAAMAVVVLTGVVQMWHIYTLAFLLGIGMAMNQPVRTSLIPELVGKRHMLNALSLNSIAINGTRFIGPALVGFIIAAWGVGPAYVLGTVAYAAVIWTTTRLDLPPPVAGRDQGNMLEQLLEGFRFIASHRLVLTLVLLGLGPLAFGFAHQTLLPALVTEVLHSDAGLMGLIQSAGAIGGLSGGLYLASKGEFSRKGLLMLVTATTYGVALILFAGVTMIALVFPLIIVIGVSQTMFRSANTVTLLEITPDHLRGRIVSVTLLDTALAPAAALIAGLAADTSGIGAGYLTLGGMCLGVVLLSLAVYPRLRSI